MINEVNNIFNNNDKRETLMIALDIRKFEIDLYWRRATYFWAFIALAFAGYFALLSAKNIYYLDRIVLESLLSCIGFIFSLSWYFVNRGSKFWQLNWESHVDIHEDEFIGPLLKTTLYKGQFPLCNLLGPFAFSVSKINTILSLYVTFIWFFLIVRVILIFTFPYNNLINNSFIILVVLLSIITAIFLLQKGQTSEKEELRQFIVRKQKSIIRN